MRPASVNRVLRRKPGANELEWGQSIECHQHLLTSPEPGLASRWIPTGADDRITNSEDADWLVAGDTAVCEGMQENVRALLEA